MNHLSSFPLLRVRKYRMPYQAHFLISFYHLSEAFGLGKVLNRKKVKGRDGHSSRIHFFEMNQEGGFPKIHVTHAEVDRAEVDRSRSPSEHVSQDSPLGKKVKTSAWLGESWGMFFLTSCLTCSFIFKACSFPHSFTGITICYLCMRMLLKRPQAAPVAAAFKLLECSRVRNKVYHPAVEERERPGACSLMFKTESVNGEAFV